MISSEAKYSIHEDTGVLYDTRYVDDMDMIVKQESVPTLFVNFKPSVDVNIDEIYQKLNSLKEQLRALKRLYLAGAFQIGVTNNGLNQPSLYENLVEVLITEGSTPDSFYYILKASPNLAKLDIKVDGQLSGEEVSFPKSLKFVRIIADEMDDCLVISLFQACRNLSDINMLSHTKYPLDMTLVLPSLNETVQTFRLLGAEMDVSNEDIEFARCETQNVDLAFSACSEQAAHMLGQYFCNAKSLMINIDRNMAQGGPPMMNIATFLKTFPSVDDCQVFATRPGYLQGSIELSAAKNMVIFQGECSSPEFLSALADEPQNANQAIKTNTKKLKRVAAGHFDAKYIFETF